MDRTGSGFRRLIGLLVVLNIGVLLMGMGLNYWASKVSPPLTFNADKIQLLQDVRPVKAKPQPDVEAPSDTVPPEESSQEKVACPAWGGLNADQVSQIESHLRQFGVPDGADDLQLGMRLGWWVYLPPMANAQALQVVMEDARSKGVKDMAQVRSGPMENALSLGVFPGYDGARKHAQAMTNRGLRGVRFGPRPDSGLVQLVVLQDTPQIRKALGSTWPPGLSPNACQP